MGGQGSGDGRLNFREDAVGGVDQVMALATASARQLGKAARRERCQLVLARDERAKLCCRAWRSTSGHDVLLEAASLP